MLSGHESYCLYRVVSLVALEYTIIMITDKDYQDSVLQRIA